MSPAEIAAAYEFAQLVFAGLAAIHVGKEPTDDQLRALRAANEAHAAATLAKLDQVDPNG